MPVFCNIFNKCDFVFASSILGLWFMDETSVLYVQEVLVTFWCSMTFKWYPMDTQICKFKIGSFSSDQNTLIFQTNALSHENLDKNAVLDYSAQAFLLNDYDTFIIWASEADVNYSVAGFEIHLQRHSSKYLVNYYLPSGLFVVTSWVMLV